MQLPLRKIVVAFLLTSLLLMVFFSFSGMMRGADGQMEGNCPFSVMGVPLCPQDTLAAAVHHISAYQSFLAGFAASGMSALIIAFLIALFVSLLLLAVPLLYKPPELAKSFFTASSTARNDRKEIRWLSLFENSPSLA